jgi:hypothetical protein
MTAAPAAPTRNRNDYTTLAQLAADCAADLGATLQGYATDDGDAADWYVYVDSFKTYNTTIFCFPATGDAWTDSGDTHDCRDEVVDAGGTWLDHSI